LISFPDLPLHPSVAAALAARDYTTATPVQAAVLAPELYGKDLLVSAPTGSGKTVAFGTMIAQTVLAEKRPEGAEQTAEDSAGERTGDGEAAAAEPARAPRPARGGKAPRALVVAPTRELANQVGNELGWLLAQAKLRIGAFTGGTSVPGDVRRLRAGLDVVVGTPGRLVDLHERGSLDLSAIEVLVLDEADEMLDLGFREALEYLLSKAPPERRTLLFSATLPPEIARMAATYQRGAVRVDPREKGQAAPHADIEHVAHLVRPQDRLAAVVNVLTAAGNGKAIVFCRTREGVGELQQRLLDHGLRAVAMSGDRAQGDRDRALGALRSGRARVLVATNVAARGLDLPDVELVLHADLPENAEALTHRSGRTGRAGRKGRSVVIADMRERRKAERLLHAGRTNAKWVPAPTANDVKRSLVEALLSELMESAHDRRQAEDAGSEQAGAGILTAELADRLRAALPERVLIAELLARELSRLPAPLPLEPLDPRVRPEPPRLSTGARAGARVREQRPDSYGPVWTDAVLFRVNLGAAANAEPGWLLPLICRRGGVTRREVGAIRIGPQGSTFEISAEAAADFALAAAERDPRAPHVVIEPADAPARPESPRDRDERPRPPRSERGQDARFGRPRVEAERPSAAPRGRAPASHDDDGPFAGLDHVGETPVPPPAKAAPSPSEAAASRPTAPADDGLAAIDALVEARDESAKPAKPRPEKVKAAAKPAAETKPKTKSEEPAAAPASAGKAKPAERPAPYFAAASGKRGSAVMVERGPRFANRPERPAAGTRPPAGPTGGPRPAPRASADGPARGPRFGGTRLDRAPGPRDTAPRGAPAPRTGGPRGAAPRGDDEGGFEPPRFERGGRNTFGRGAHRPGGGFSPRPGSKAHPSARTDDRPRRGRPRSP
jgi:ATP-dependent RNA helicase DeaD